MTSQKSRNLHYRTDTFGGWERCTLHNSRTPDVSFKMLRTQWFHLFFQCVKAIYLHVLTTNSRAISFYEHRGFRHVKLMHDKLIIFVIFIFFWKFRPHQFLPYYYAIKGKRKDGFTYVLYINGGHPPWSLLAYMTHCCGVMCSTFNPW